MLCCFMIYLFVYIIIGLLLSLIIIVVSLFLVIRSGDVEKISAYECGFHPFQDTRNKFDVRFYLIAIIFLIFDLEIMFLLPWCILLDREGFGLLGFLSMLIFFVLIILGLIYEWRKGGLDWE